MSNEGRKSLQEELGDGYLSLLDSVRHSFEQAAWGQETSGDLSADFYRWAGAEPEPAQAAGLGGGIEVTGQGERDNAPDRGGDDFEAWIDGKVEAKGEPVRGIEQERDGPELGD